MLQKLWHVIPNNTKTKLKYPWQLSREGWNAQAIFLFTAFPFFITLCSNIPFTAFPYFIILCSNFPFTSFPFFITLCSNQPNVTRTSRVLTITRDIHSLFPVLHASDPIWDPRLWLLINNLKIIDRLTEGWIRRCEVTYELRLLKCH